MKKLQTGIDGIDSYCKDIISGKIAACRWVVKAVERHYRDLRKSNAGKLEYYFEPKAAQHFFDFCYKRKHYEGDVAGLPIELEPWQQFVWGSIFGWIHKKTKHRRFRETHIEIPKKNGKSILGALIALYGITYDDEPGAQVYNLAINRTQVMKLSYRAAMEMSEKDPELSPMLHVKKSMADMKIECKETSSFFEPLTSKPDRLDGFNVHMSINDETKDWTQLEIYDLMEDGMATRTQPLLYNVTTAGDNRRSLGYQKREYSIGVLDSVIKNEMFFCIIYSIDEEDVDKWDDIKTWKKANPNFGVSVREMYYKSQVTRGRESHHKKMDVLTKNLNVWVNAASSWMNIDQWNECGDDKLTIDDVKHLPAIISLDLASKVDIAAVMIMFYDHDMEDFYFFLRGYLPEEYLADSVDKSKEDRANKKLYRVWADQGHLILTPGYKIDQDFIKQDVQDMMRAYKVERIAYDPFQATKLVTEFEKEDLPVIEYRHIVNNMSEPMKELEAIVGSGKLHHDNNPVFTWMMSNVVAKEDVKRNIYPRRKDDESKIDGAIAAIMCLGTYLFELKDEEDENLSPAARRALEAMKEEAAK